MGSPNGSNDTTRIPPPLSFYNTFKFVHGFCLFITYSQTDMSADAFIPYLSLLCSVFEINFLNHASCNIFLPVNVYRTPSFKTLNSAFEEFQLVTNRVLTQESAPESHSIYRFSELGSLHIWVLLLLRGPQHRVPCFWTLHVQYGKSLGPSEIFLYYFLYEIP